METQYIKKDPFGVFYYKDPEMKIPHREDGPACEWYVGYKEWWVDGKRHRLDGPACDYENKCRSWWIDGVLSRRDGPAIECPNGNKEWWIEGEDYTEEEFNNITKEY